MRARYPPVEVRPPDDEGTGEEGTLPSVDVSPGPTYFDNYGGNPMYPSLSETFAGGFAGGLRGAPLSLFDDPRAIDIIDQQLLLEKSPTDIGQALEQTVGVMVQRTGRGQSSPFVRGLTGPQVLIMVDGIRMTNATFRAGPNQYFNLIDPNMVERIEVIRGPGSVLYGGDAIGGVINIVTKEARFSTYDFNTGGTIQRFSTYDLGYSGRVDVEGSVGSMSYFGGGGYGNYNNLDIGGTPDAPAGFDPGRQPATSWGYYSADLKLNWRIDECAEIVWGLQRYAANDVFRTDRFPADRESVFGPQIRELYYMRLNAISYGGLADTYQITGSFSNFDETREDRDFRTGRNPDLVSRRGFTDEQFGLNIALGKDLGYAGWLSYGFDWYHDEINSTRVDTDYAVMPPTVDVLPGEIPNDSFYSRYGAYLQWDVWLTDRLLASSGVRFEHVTAGATVTAGGTTGHIDPEFSGWVGQIGLTYELTDQLHLVGSINQGFRAPNIDDLATINGNVFVGTDLPNPNLDPELATCYEVGVKYNSDRAWCQTFVYWTDIDDYIVRGAPNTMNLLERTNAAAYINGVEFSGEYLLTDTWSVYGNFWYTYGQDTVNDEPLSRIPPMQGILGVRKRWNCGNNWFDVYTWMVDKQDRLAPRDISDTNRIPVGGTPGYVTLNFRYGHMISDRQRLSVNFENVFDEQYRVHGSGSDGPGIGATLSYEMLR